MVWMTSLSYINLHYIISSVYQIATKHSYYEKSNYTLIISSGTHDANCGCR